MVEEAPGARLENLGRIYNRDEETVHAVSDVSLTLHPGTFTALIGYSGCGKTTLLRLLAGLESPTSGSVSLFPEDAYPAVVYQDPRLLPWMTVKKNLQIALRHRRGTAGNKTEQKKRVREVLSLVGLSDRGNAYPHELSGGMAQRAGLARALCQKSGFLLMDEPFSALDALTREKLQRELKSIWQDRQSTILFITHDMSEALYLAQRILIMKEGRIIADLNEQDWDEQNDREAVLRDMMATASRKSMVLS